MTSLTRLLFIDTLLEHERGYSKYNAFLTLSDRESVSDFKNQFHPFIQYLFNCNISYTHLLVSNLMFRQPSGI